MQQLTRETAKKIRTIAAMPTPFSKNGIGGRDAPIDPDQVLKLLSHLLGSHIDGIAIAGTTGESATLTITEQRTLFKMVAQFVGERCTIIAGSGGNSTLEALELTKAAEEYAHAVLSVMPYYNKPEPEGQYRHFRTIAEVGMPVILYSVKSRTGRSIDLKVVERLALECPNIIGIKEADGDIKRYHAIRAACPADFVIWSGEDHLSFEAMRQGNCDGVISVVANVAPALTKDMVEKATNGNPNGGRMTFDQLKPLCHALFIETNPQPVKTALEMMGVIDKACFRLPMVRMENEARHRLELQLRKGGFLT